MSTNKRLALGDELVRVLLFTAVTAVGSVFTMWAVRRFVLHDVFEPAVEAHTSTGDKGDALTSYEAHFMRSVVSPGDAALVDYSGVGGLAAQLEDIRRAVIMPLSHAHVYAHSRLARRPTGLLLHGPPGTGKTLLAKVIAHHANAVFINVSIGTVLSKYVGDSQKLVEALFSVAKRCGKCVIFIDEADALFGKRRGGGGEDGTGRQWLDLVVNSFLACWDGLEAAPAGGAGASWVLVVGATNRPDALDPAVLRRFSRQVAVPMPDEGDRAAILTVHLHGELVAPDVNVASVSAACDGMSGSDLREVTRLAAQAGIARTLDAVEAGGALPAPEPITTAMLLEAVGEWRRSTGRPALAATRASAQHVSCASARGHVSSCVQCNARWERAVQDAERQRAQSIPPD